MISSFFVLDCIILRFTILIYMTLNYMMLHYTAVLLYNATIRFE